MHALLVGALLPLLVLVVGDTAEQPDTGADGGSDADDDGDSDGEDLLLWQRQFATGAAASAIPEPGASSMFIWIALAALGVRRSERAHATLPVDD